MNLSDIEAMEAYGGNDPPVALALLLVSLLASLAVVGLLVLAEIRLAAGHWIASAGRLVLLAVGTGLLFP